MIIFKTISIKNFLSYGNSPTTWNLNKDKSTLIIGRNGHGKSVLLDAVCFGLFGKPFRNVNKPQLINSINQKGCVVDLEILVNGVPYRIIRGMKPNIFDVYCDQKMLDQEAAMKDMQVYLEQQILKLNFKTFCQVVILGSASYTPFMQLPAHQRREIVEDVLDIGIFGKMNSLLKDRFAGTKEELRIIDVKVDSAKKEAQSQKRIIELIEKNKSSRISEINDEIDILRCDLLTVEENISLLEKPDYEENNSIREKYNAAVDQIDTLKSTATQMQVKLSKLEKLKECPTCMQGISHEHKHHIKDMFEKDGASISVKLEEQYPSLSELGEMLELAEKAERHYSVTHIAMTKEMADLNKSILDKEKQIRKLSEDSGDIDSEKEKMKSIASEALKFISRKNELSEEKQLQEVSQVLLKDNGIKTAIIKEYLPVLNKLINKYLTVFDFFVNFNLDESFNEIIKSRGRDEFSYASFSEGEKAKINISVLFAFRQVAAMKNSVRTNLLIMDEAFDSSLDLESVESLSTILTELSSTNLFVVSHRGMEHFDKFEKIIEIRKNGGFSSIEYTK